MRISKNNLGPLDLGHALVLVHDLSQVVFPENAGCVMYVRGRADI